MRSVEQVQARLDAAARLCASAGARFTPLRRHILELVLTAGGPVTAYGLLHRLEGGRWAAAPPTVYRALEFLTQHGLIHRVERLQAYIGCDESHAHAAQLLICRDCGTVAEVDDLAVQHALDHAARDHGFAPLLTVVEMEGTCAACRVEARPGAHGADAQD